MIKHHWISYSF